MEDTLDIPVAVREPLTEYKVGTDRPDTTDKKPPADEYVVKKEHKDGIMRIMDTIGEDPALTPEVRKSLEDFEERLIAYEIKAREKGKPVGIDYFANYKQGFKDKFVAIGGAAALAVLMPIVMHQLKDITYFDPETGEEKHIDPLYKPDGKNGSEVVKLRSQKPGVELTAEQQAIALQIGKLPDDPRIINSFFKYLRKLGLDETPQLASVGWGVMNLFGPRSLHRMADRAQNEGIMVDKKLVKFHYDEKYPELFQVYQDAIDAGVKKGLAGGYGAVEGVRGTGTLAQMAADGILMAHASQYSENYILGRTMITALTAKGAK